MTILHIYGARAISNYFVITKTLNQSKKEMEISVAGPIFIQKRSKALCRNDIPTPKEGRKDCGDSSYLCIYSHFITRL